ncbi:MAG: hypothetical protein ACRBCI_15875 [Cellvibrionaceae bacterium]
MNTTHSLLPEILELTKNMLVSCESMEWEKLAEIENERNSLMQSIDIDDLRSHKENIAAIEEIIEINNKILNDTKKAKNKNQQSLIDLKRNVKKTSLYKNN